MKQLFIIANETLNALEKNEVMATVAALKELGLYRLPYPSVSVRIPVRGTKFVDQKGRVVVRDDGRTPFLSRPNEDGTFSVDLPDGHYLEYRGINLDGKPWELRILHDGSDPNFRRYDMDAAPSEVAWKSDAPGRDVMPSGPARAQEVCDNLIAALVVLLATKNARKETVHNPLAKHRLGSAKRPGSAKRYEYVTTISLPHEMPPDEEHPPAGREVCAHLRRGHVRRQHYGPKNAFVRKVFIEPVLVNADKEWTAQRVAYNVSL